MPCFDNVTANNHFLLSRGFFLAELGEESEVFGRGGKGGGVDVRDLPRGGGAGGDAVLPRGGGVGGAEVTSAAFLFFANSAAKAQPFLAGNLLDMACTC